MNMSIFLSAKYDLYDILCLSIFFKRLNCSVECDLAGLNPPLQIAKMLLE